MKITALETIRIAERPNLIWVQVHTDQGLIGLGETFFGASTVEAHVHDHIAPRVIGRDPLEIDKLSADLVGYLGFRSSGAEVRGNSAFDIALWDIFGKATGQPIAQLLGGFTRREIRTNNTCVQPTNRVLRQNRKTPGCAVSRHLHLNILRRLAGKILLVKPLAIEGIYPVLMP